MKIKVMKFGGTSLASSEARTQSALRVISAKELGFHPVVVVSAIGRKGAPYATDTLIGHAHSDRVERVVGRIGNWGNRVS